MIRRHTVENPFSNEKPKEGCKKFIPYGGIRIKTWQVRIKTVGQYNEWIFEMMQKIICLYFDRFTL
ncbi:MAG TPA: hypothetical protein DHW71_16295 [Gammaproteobacteria bacterium]|nr:hypothetical protein [Gammaproteobacteria bacterium]HBF08316.1 hypothetical protein [Gammaproteobacteria bacterium]HCK94557.1 hypothetical protein [Gammaproteobacteria bacterium]